MAGKKGWGAVAVGVLAGALVMSMEKDDPGTTARNTGEVTDVGTGLLGEVVAVVPKTQEAIAPGLQTLSSVVAGAGAVAGGQGGPEGPALPSTPAAPGSAP